MSTKNSNVQRKTLREVETVYLGTYLVTPQGVKKKQIKQHYDESY